MERRERLQVLLEELIGSSNVYFQPPASKDISYPCIIYKRGISDNTLFAGDQVYQHNVKYELTVVDKDPDSPLLSKMLSLPMCKFDRHFTSDNLNHDVYIIYY